MSRRSLRASTQGIQRIKAELKRRKWNQTYLAGVADCSRQTIWSLLNGKPIDADIFLAVCKHLDLDDQEIAEPEDREEPAGRSLDIDNLVIQVRRKLKPVLQEKCGTMRVLDMEQPIGLGDIYTDVNILEKLTANRRLRLEELLEACNREEFEQFGFSHLQQKERVPGLDAVEQYPKILILGKPGAGKTTFLKRIATQCNLGELYPKKVPLFITLKDFAEEKEQPRLLEFITNRLAEVQVTHAQEVAQELLHGGRMLLLLDGLDEVSKDDSQRVAKEIRQFAEIYHSNHFLLTCRIAAQEYTFEHFAEVEIADFDDQQIAVFATKWFAQKDPTKTERLLRKLRDNSRVKELATNPLLLTLLCLGFEQANYLDPSRSGLYKEGLDVLLKKWDAKRSIERGEIYKNLKLERKKELLSQLAYNTFSSGNYFFKQELAEAEIRNYIVNLPESPNDPRQLDLDSEEVLGAIASQHGLLIERASHIYSFSHLTFHEYFTAQYIVSSLDLENSLSELVNHLHDNRWHEVFILITEMLPKADLLLLKMKKKIDCLMIRDAKLQDFLLWAKTKSTTVKEQLKPAAIRAYYVCFPFAWNLYRHLPLDIDINLNPDFNQDFLLDSSLDDLLYFLQRPLDIDPNIYQNHLHRLQRILNRSVAIAQFKVKEVLQELKEVLSEVKANQDKLEYWWQEHRMAWIGELRNVMVQYRNIGHSWQFNREQENLLSQYLEVNQLLVDCLNSECYVTRSVREEIENTLLLPATDLDK